MKGKNVNWKRVFRKIRMEKRKKVKDMRAEAAKEKASQPENYIFQ